MKLFAAVANPGCPINPPVWEIYGAEALNNEVRELIELTLKRVEIEIALRVLQLFEIVGSRRSNHRSQRRLLGFDDARLLRLKADLTLC